MRGPLFTGIKKLSLSLVLSLFIFISGASFFSLQIFSRIVSATPTQDRKLNLRLTKEDREIILNLELLLYYDLFKNFYLFRYLSIFSPGEKQIVSNNSNKSAKIKK